MLGKNNYNERLRKMEMQAKQDRFSIRKLSIGAASVLLGFSFLGLNANKVEADTVSADTTNTIKAQDEQSAEAKPAKQAAKTDLSTYEGLSAFLKSDDQTGAAKDKDTNPAAAKNPEKPLSDGDADQNQDHHDATKPDDEEQPDDEDPEGPSQTAQQKPDEASKPVTTDPENTNSSITDDSQAATDQKPAVIVTDDAQITPQASDGHVPDLFTPSNGSGNCKVDRNSVISKTEDKEVDVYDWQDLVDAFYNSKINTINVAADIQAPTNINSATRLMIPARKLVVRAKDSDENDPSSARHIIDFQMFEPGTYDGSATALDITYQNLDIYSRTFYGIINTSKDKYSKVNIKNVNFIGSQMLYVGQHTEARFSGTNHAETVSTYTNPLNENDTTSYTMQADNQQLFQFSDRGGRLTFAAGSTFTGTTYMGDVIEMQGGASGTDTININGENVSLAADNEIIIEKGAQVKLNPAGATDVPRNANGGENNAVPTGIAVISGQGSVLVQDGGHLEIDVGGSEYDGANLNNRRAKAIILNGSGSSMTLADNASVVVNTNGNISDRNQNSSGAGVLISVGGNLSTGDKAKFIVNGSNMGTYSGTLVSIGGSADITGTDFEIKLDNASSGTGNLTLFSAGKNTVVSNPEDFLLDAGANVSAALVPSGSFTLNSVRLRHPDGSVSDPFRIFGFHGIGGGKLKADEANIEGMTVEQEKDNITRINNPDGVRRLEFLAANMDGFVTIDPISLADIVIDENGNEIINGYVSQAEALISVAMPNPADDAKINNQIDSPYHKEQEAGIKYAAQSSKTAETSGNHAGKYKFTITIPAELLPKDNGTTPQMATLSANKDFVEGDPSLPEAERQNPQQAKLVTPSDIESILEQQKDNAAQEIQSTASKAKETINSIFGNDAAAAKPYLDEIDNIVNASTNKEAVAGDPDSVYVPNDMSAVTNRKDTAINKIKDQVKQARKANQAATINAAKQQVKDWADKGNELLGYQAGSAGDPDIAKALDDANQAIEAAANDENGDLDQAITNGQNAILAAYKQAAKKQIDNDFTNKNNLVNNSLALSKDQKTKYSQELADAKDADEATIDAVDNLNPDQTKPAGTLQSVYDPIEAVSDLRRYKNQLKQKYPDNTELNQALETTSKQWEDQIDADKQDPAKWNDDLAKGKDALKQLVAKEFASDLQTELDADKDKLSDLAADNEAVNHAIQAAQAAIDDIVNANDDDDANQKHDTAQKALDKLNSIIELQAEAKAQKQQYGETYPTTGVSGNEAAANKPIIDDINQGIDNALNAAINNVTAASDDDLANVTNQGVVDIDKVGAQKQLAQKAQDVEQQLNALSGHGLSATEIDEQVQAAKDLVSNEANTGYSDAITAATSQDDVSGNLTDGLNALDDLLNQQKLIASQNAAITAIQNAQTEANTAIDETNLSDEAKAAAKKQVKTIADNAVSKINKDQTPAAVTTDKNKALEDIQNVVNNINNDNTALTTAQTSAISDLQAAANQAKTDIDNLPADQLSASQKQEFKQKVDDDLADAIANVNSAGNTDDVDEAKTTGKQKINADRDAAQLAADKAKALQDLETTKDNDTAAINNLLTDGKINQATADKAKNDIKGYYDHAVAAVNNAKDSETVTDEKNNGIDAMNGVVTTATNDADGAISAAKTEATDKLDTLANQIKQNIKNNPNLGNDEKDDFIGQVDTALSTAKQNIGKATTVDAVNKAEGRGESALNAVDAAAKLQGTKNDALKALLNTYNKDKSQINAMTNIDSDKKNQMLTELKGDYDTAVGKVKDPQTNTINKVQAEKQTGITNMDSVLTNAGNLDGAISEAQEKLEQVAKDAKDRIDKSDLADKEAAKNAIDEALNSAKADVASKDNVTDINQAEQDGEQAILAAEQDSTLKDAKAKAKEKLAQYAETAKAKIPANLTEDQAKQVETAIDNAVTDANQAIDAATSETGVNNQEGAGEVNIDSVLADANLLSAKEEDKQDVQNHLDQAGLTGDALEDAQQVVEQAKQNIDNATSVAAADKLREDAIKAIDNIKKNQNNQELNNAKDAAIAELDAELGDANSGVLAGIAALAKPAGNLTPEEVTQYQNQAQKAHDDAVNKVNSAANATEVNKNKETGISKIDQALTDAKLQDKKNQAKADLNTYAETAKTAIDGKDLDQKTKDKLKGQIDQVVDDINKDIDAATTGSTINTAENDGKQKIDNVASSADNAELSSARENALTNLHDKANTVQTSLDNALNDGSLTSGQYQDLTNDLNDAVANAEDAINAANTVTDINQEEQNGEDAIDGVSSDANLDKTMNKDLAALQTAANNANDKIDELTGFTPEQKQDMKDQVESERAKAAKNVRDQHKANSASGMNHAKNDGITAINNVTNGFVDKNTAIEKLKDEAQTAKDTLQAAATNPEDPNHPFLNDTELATANNAVDTALDTAISNILAADPADIGENGSVFNDAKDLISNSTLPAQLQAEKNKQIAAINKYAAEKTDSLADLTDLTPEQIADLTADLETARKKTVNKINDVSLPAQATPADLADAKTQLTDIEKGTVTGETIDFGEAGIDKIVAAANDSAAYNHKQEAIKELEEAYDKTQDRIKNSGLTPNQQKDKLEEAKTAFNAAKQNIIDATGADTAAINAAADTALTNGKTELDKIAGLTEAEGQKSAALDKLKAKQNSAKDIINHSQLTVEQKQAALAEIDKAYEIGKTSITDLSTVDKEGNQLDSTAIKAAIIAAETTGEHLIDEVINKDSGNKNYPWFNNEIENTKDLAEDFDKLTDKQKADNPELVAAINTAITDLNNATDIGSASDAYSRGKTALNKLNAIEEVKQAAQNAKDIINNTQLTAEQKQTAISEIDDYQTAAINAINAVNQPAGDVDGIANNIKDTVTTGENNINSVLSQVTEQARKEAKQALTAAYNNAKQELGNDKHSNLDTAYNNALAALNSADKVESVNQAKDDGIKNLANSALDDAATNANTTIDQASNLSTTQKDKLKADVAAAVAAGNTAIAAAGSDAEKVDQARKDAISEINKITTSANDLDQAIDKAKQALEAARNQAGEKLGSVVDASKLDDDLADAESKLDGITNLNEIEGIKDSGIKQIANDAVQAAAEYVTNNLSDLSESQLSQINDEIATAVDEGNKAIESAGNNDIAITAARDNAIDKILGIKTDSDQLATDANDAKAAIDQAASAAKAEVDKLGEEYSPEDKQKLKDDIDQAADQAKAKIDKASNKDTVDKAKTDGINSINNTLALDKAKHELQSAYNDAISKLPAGADHSALDTALQEALTNVDNATDSEGIETAKNDSIKEIAKEAVEAVANNAIATIDGQANLSEAQKDNLKNQVNAAKAEAIKETDGTIDKANGTEAVGDARDEAINAINNIGTNGADLGASASAAKDELQSAYNDAISELPEGVDHSDLDDALQGALANIDSATKPEDIDKAKNDGINSINNTLAKDKAKHELQSAYEEAIIGLGDNPSDEAKRPFDDALQGALANIDSATDSESIETAKTDGIKEIAKDVIDQAATAAKAEVDKLGEEYTPEDKQKLKGDIDQAAAKAKAEIDNAPNQDAVDQAKNDGINNINDTLAKDKAKHELETAYNDAVSKLPAGADHSDLDDALQGALANINGATDSEGIEAAKTEGIKEIAKEAVKAVANDAIAAINGQANLSEAQKDDLKNRINAAKDEAIKETDGTIDKADGTEAVGKARDEAIDKINGIGTIGSDLNTNVNSAKEELQHAYDDAVNNLPTDADQATKDKLKQDFDKANNDIDKAIKPEDIDKAKTDGIKEIAKDVISVAVDQTKAEVDKLGDEYSPDDKQKLKEDIDQAADQAKAEIDKAPNKDAVEQAKTDGINSINNTLAKDKAKHELQSAYNDAISKLPAGADQATKDKLKQDFDKANGAIDQATSEDNVDKAKTDGIKEIAKDVISVAADQAKAGVDQLGDEYNPDDKQKLKEDIDQAADQAKAEVDKAPNKDAVDQAKTDGINSINNTLAKDKAKHELQSAYNDAVNNLPAGADHLKLDTTLNNALANIDSATDSEGIETAKNNGIKQVAKDAVAAVANSAIAAIDGQTNLSEAQKNDLKSQINSAKDEAIKETEGTIDKAKDTATVDKAKTDAIDKINSIGASGTDLDASVSAAKEELQTAYEDAVNNLPTDADQATKDKLKQDFDEAKGDVDKATKPEDVDKAKNDGIKQVAKDAVEAEANSAIAAIDSQTNLSQAQKDDLKGQINAAKAEAIKETDGTIDKANSKDEVNTAKNNAINKIKGISTSGSQISDAKDAIDQAANAAKAEVDKLGEEYTPEDKQKLKADIDMAATSAKGNVDKAKNSDEVDKAKTDGINSINDTLALDKAKHEAQKELQSAYNDAIGKLPVGADHSDLDTALQEALTNVDNATDSEGIETAKNDSIKEIAKEAVAAVANNAIAAIDGQTNLSEAQKDDFKGQINAAKAEAIKEAEGTIDQSNDAVAVGKARDEAIDKINGINVSGANLANTISTAKDELQSAYNDAIGKLPAGADHSALDTAFETAKNNLDQTTKPEDITSLKDQGIKQVAKDAVAAAANHAKEQIDKMTDYSKDQQKQLKDEIDKIVAAANDSIDKATNVEDVNSARDNAIEEIGKVANDQDRINGILGIYPTLPGTSVAPNEKPEAAKEVKLMHNAYLYNEAGQRANEVVLNHGSIVKTYGTKLIDGREFYILHDGDNVYYLATGNVLSTKRTLTHNSYVYNKYGKRVGKQVLPKGSDIDTYGSAITIRGQKYYVIGNGQYVKAANLVATLQPRVEAEVAPISIAPEAEQKAVMHNAYIYNKYGKRANQVVIKAGSKVTVVGLTEINGREFYQLADGNYLAAGNIKGQKRTLSHNAYVYSQYGNRMGKQVLKRHKSITTYGDPISIHGKKYYIIANGKHVKAANF
ncbi:DUF1542 domain-containing protein [Lactobacillus sp. ESL0681]|uniref:DUF1542 domain-containing protein n=1 Tax=Lactobacillus sp. ESL0681 TaxID=2983211 RepID=UPI0023F7B754|nr:DUF1542 domain-containing protein [Lactobacillus sp. ESL0681]WEV40885.1 DUF1542 domain-containing protein [Lactobacillus sp. ESL0681]